MGTIIILSEHQQLLEQGYEIMTFTPLYTGIPKVINIPLGGSHIDINGKTYRRSLDPSNGQFYTKELIMNMRKYQTKGKFKD